MTKVANTPLRELSNGTLRMIVRQARETYGPRTQRWPDRACAARRELACRGQDA